MFLSRITGGFHKLCPAGKARVILAALAALLLGYLLFADKPWSVSVEAGKNLKISQYVTIYLWIAVLIDLVLVALLSATAHWWAAPSRELPTPKSQIPNPKWFWPLVIAAMALNAVLCWPRLTHSFWHDETYPIRNAIVGTYKKQEDGSLKLKPVSWQETFFFYRKPNHTLYSGIARAANEVWRAIARPKGLQFNEAVIRFPAYLAGIASIATIALLLRHMGFFSAGVLAAFLSAIHPWHIRYASEARAYAFVLMLIPLVIIFFLKAVESGRWRWWAAFGTAQFFLLYFYPTCAYVLVVLNLYALPAIWCRWGGTAETVTQFFRWVVANICAAMVFLPLMLPCVPQFLAYVKGTPGQGQLDTLWAANFLAHLLAGIPWTYLGHTEPGSIELFPWYQAHPTLGVFIALLTAVFLVLGICRMMARDRTSALVPLMLLLPAIICYADTKIRGSFVNEWYLIFLLPGVIALVALGLDQIFALARTPPLKIAAGVAVVLVISGFTAWTAPQRKFLMRHSIQPNRETVERTRPTLDPQDPRQKDIMTATFYGAPEPYDPNIITFRNAREMGELLRQADAEGKSLYINLGYLTTVEGEHAVKYEFLKSSGLFEDLGLYPGFEPSLQSRHLFKYKPGAAAAFDFEKLPPDRGRPGTGFSY